MSSRRRRSTSAPNRCASCPRSGSLGRLTIHGGTRSCRVARTFSMSSVLVSGKFPIRSERGTAAGGATIPALLGPTPFPFCRAYTTDWAPSRSVFANRTMYRKSSFASGGRVARAVAFGGAGGGPGGGGGGGGGGAGGGDAAGGS